MNNPKYEFYRLLLIFITAKVKYVETMEKLVQIYQQNPGEISLPEVTREHLDSWFDSQKEGYPDQEVYEGWWMLGHGSREEVCEYCFIDLVSQMRTDTVRTIMIGWMNNAGVPEDLFTHVRKVKPLGDDFAVATVVVSNFKLFKRLLIESDFETYAGCLHSSQASEEE